MDFFFLLYYVCVLKKIYKANELKTKQKKKAKRGLNNLHQLHVDHVNDSTAGADCSGKDRGEQVGVQFILQC